MAKKDIKIDNKHFREKEMAVVVRKGGKVQEISTVRIGEKFMVDNREVTVKEPCKVDTGIWYCLTHKESFNSQFSKDVHLTGVKGKHRLAWLCFEHGYEQP